MNEVYSKLFENMVEVNPPADLCSKILLGIDRVSQRRQKLAILVARLALFVSSLTAVLALVYLISGIYQSEFYQYFLLLFSEGLGILNYWQELFLSLAQSMPIFETVIFLMAVIFLMISIRLLAKNYNPKKYFYLNS